MSMPSTSVPAASNSSASEPPKRPSPMTATAPTVGRRAPWGVKGPVLANEGPFLREFEKYGPLAQRERGGQGDRAEAADEHQQDQHQLPGWPQVAGDAGSQAHRGEG